MRGAARAKDLKRQSTHIIRSHIYYKYGLDSKVKRTFPQLLQWCFLRMTVKGALQAMQELQASSGTQSGGSTESQQQLTPPGPVIRHHSVCSKENDANATLGGLGESRLTFELPLPGLGCHL